MKKDNADRAFEQSANAVSRGRKPYPKELEKHTILVTPALWTWARSQVGGAGRLIRNLLIQAQEEEEDVEQYSQGLPLPLRSAVPSRRHLSVSTPSGSIVVVAGEKGITVTLAGEPVLTYVYDQRRKCLVIVVPTPVSLSENNPDEFSEDDFSGLIFPSSENG